MGSKTITLSDRVMHEQTPGMVGLFFEDINFAADGGLYAEMIENRSFEAVDGWGVAGSFYNIPDPGYAWSAHAGEDGSLPELLFVTGDAVSEVNPHYLRMTTTTAGQGVENKAYDGIYLEAGKKYTVSFYARAVMPGPAKVTVSVEKDGESACAASVDLEPGMYHMPYVDLKEYTLSLFKAEDSLTSMVEGIRNAVPPEMYAKPISGWKKYTLTLTAEKDVKGGAFVMAADKACILEFDFISMIPEDAVAGIFRRDLFEALANIHPGFIRFPGGCIVEGASLENRYRWKRTVGPVEGRKIIPNLWAYSDRQPGFNVQRDHDSHYSQSYGIGFYEYFLLCELLGAKPLPVLSVGLACQFRSHEKVAVDDPAFQEYLQDALDLIEFANGDVDTKWGALRAEMGHPEPFNLTMIGIGNEQWETKYADFFARATLFEKAIHDQYPDIRIIGSAGPNVDSGVWRESWAYYRDAEEVRPGGAYAVDEHYYVPPQWLYDNVDFYDNYPRTIGVFAGEYAAHTENKDNSMEAALAEAAFLTGVEKNGDVVKLASYAPLFNRVGHSQWAPDMIWFDAEKVYLTPSYYVQKLFSEHAGDTALFMDGQEKALAAEKIYMNITGLHNEAGQLTEFIVKIVNASEEDAQVTLALPDGYVPGGAYAFFLTGGKQVEGLPERAALRGREVDPDGVSLPARSFAVVRVAVVKAD